MVHLVKLCHYASIQERVYMPMNMCMCLVQTFLALRRNHTHVRAKNKASIQTQWSFASHSALVRPNWIPEKAETTMFREGLRWGRNALGVWTFHSVAWESWTNGLKKFRYFSLPFSLVLWLLVRYLYWQGFWVFLIDWFLYVWVFSLHVCVPDVHARGSQKPEDPIGSAGTGVADGCQLPFECWELNPIWLEPLIG